MLTRTRMRPLWRCTPRRTTSYGTLLKRLQCCGRNWVAFDKISAQIREAPFRERGPESAHSVRQGFQTDGRRYQRSCSANARCRLLGPPMPGRGHRGEKQCEFVPGVIKHRPFHCQSTTAPSAFVSDFSSVLGHSMAVGTSFSSSDGATQASLVALTCTER